MNNRGADAVAVRGLHVRRGRTDVFRDLHLAVPRGQITGLLGPSGCGKTTLMRSIVGVQKVSGGTVTVLGEAAGSRALRHRVAYDTQAASVYGDLTIHQNLRYFARLVGAPRADIDRVIEQTGLQDQRHQTIDSLSGGQENRVSLAVAMLGAPELIVLDEPTVGLDPLLRAELWSVFRGLADAGATLIVSSHVMDEALRCDRLVLMRAGRIIADTTPDGLLEGTETMDPDAAFLALVERDAQRQAQAPAEARGDSGRARGRSRHGRGTPGRRRGAESPGEAEAPRRTSEEAASDHPLTRREAREHDAHGAHGDEDGEHGDEDGEHGEPGEAGEHGAHGDEDGEHGDEDGEHGDEDGEHGEPGEAGEHGAHGAHGDEDGAS